MLPLDGWPALLRPCSTWWYVVALAGWDQPNGGFFPSLFEFFKFKNEIFFIFMYVLHVVAFGEYADGLHGGGGLGACFFY
ncbi:unnamed protein product [Meloidogyne enterolobii]|uniref:Uncharacterized protein n=1 Tax=Meloidogyne enterolobii TaxID=390850 RepID=A0ACB0ZNN2_MELEN